MKKLVNGLLLAAMVSTQAYAQVNAGAQAPEKSMPFAMTQVATFNLPWRIAFLPDGRMLITEKVGPVWLVTQKGKRPPSPTFPPSCMAGRAACWASMSRPITPPIIMSI